MPNFLDAFFLGETLCTAWFTLEEIMLSFCAQAVTARLVHARGDVAFRRLSVETWILE